MDDNIISDFGNTLLTVIMVVGIIAIITTVFIGDGSTLLKDLAIKILEGMGVHVL